ncbi:sodium/proline symporter PutP [Gordonia sp. PS3]|uniref:Sodium/proline symporter n=1 Tax=Gordonia sihwensis NBRC 108236 TaxID=1223544 RepID=L7LM40_9ACTN|nr:MULTISPECIES: sodium/proline symporter PutP [Gordonia]AUH69542.1 sodium/proline symporter PutP [Gordonia sp. YC-JH1]KJR04016.1 proline:sodium symporter PutP [Gordonia sihwensis]MBY4569474.1 sodium:proline symporter [Gordonia sihwensis]WFN93989.1 sodium/proline symporter PutP [Gordonia sihwensis]GAC61098.1 putative sodium/proline symporter [Gordonia sihwensis NBRC 108236]
MTVAPDEKTIQLVAVALYFAAMLGIGWYAYRRTRNSLDDYMLAGRGLKPWVAALSAGASDMSGWLLMGLPGAMYLSGLSASWIMIGLLIGAWTNWKLVAPRLRAYTQVAGDSITIPSFFESRLHDDSRILRITCGVIILVFFTFYVSSGMVASGKFFDSSFGVDYTAGMLIVAGITMLYTLFGGFLGASLTDVAQGLLVVVALLAVPIIGIIDLGGVGATIDGVNAAMDNGLSFFAGTTVIGIISAAAWGLGYFGQPHIIVRFMALRSPSEAGVARRIGIGWMLLCALGAVGTALVGIAYFAEHTAQAPKDAETVFLSLSQLLFHPFIAGLVLAAVLAAIMSTISSQLVVCSSALVEDLYKLVAEKTGRGRELTDKTYVMLGRLGVLTIAVIAALLAISPSNSILDLVAFAWAGFGSAFGPAVILCLYWRRVSTVGVLSGIVAGAVVAYVWGQTSLSEDLYEIIPGFAASLIVTVVVSLLTFRADPEIDAEFTRAVELSRSKEPFTHQTDDVLADV